MIYFKKNDSCLKKIKPVEDFCGDDGEGMDCLIWSISCFCRSEVVCCVASSNGIIESSLVTLSSFCKTKNKEEMELN